MALGGEDAKYNKGYVRATGPKAAVVPTTGEFGSQALWEGAQPNLAAALDVAGGSGYMAGGDQFNEYVAGAKSTLDEGKNAPMSMEDVVQMLLNNKSGGGGSGQNTAAIVAALRERLKSDPYASMTQQLQRNYAAAQQTGNDALGQLRAALGGMQNAYKGVKFATPVAAGNPLAEYMAASGAGTGEVDALQQWLGSLSTNAASADRDMVNRLRASTQQDIAGRQADVGVAEAAWRQMLANSLQNQQAAIAQSTAARNEDILMQLAQMGAKP